MKTWLLRIVGFFLGGGIGLLFVATIAALTSRVSLAIIIIPVMAGVAGANLLPSLYYSSFVKRLIAQFWGASSFIRVIVIAPFFWVVCVGVFVWLFEPYGGYMSSSERCHMYKVMFFPLLLLGFGCLIYNKFIKPKNVESSNKT